MTGVFILWGGAAAAAEVELAGVFGNKAVLIVDGGAPKTLAAGEQTRDGVVRVVEVSSSAAVVEVDGRRQRLTLGAAAVRLSDAQRQTATVNLVSDAKGHHFSQGSINGASVRFMVDTGASLVAMSAADARRAGVDYMHGSEAMTQTANGPARVWHVTLDSVRVGEIVLQGVEGMVVESDLPFVLLGMSFLGRMDMQREGGRLTLRKRY